MQVKDRPNVWALGDAALVPDVSKGGWCPPTAQYAMRQGRQAARNILAALHSRSLQNFHFKGLGQMAVIGRHCGVAQIGGWKISGVLAWVLWRGVYLMKLPGLPCKVRVAIDWIMELVFPRDITKVELQRTEHLKHAHFQQGEIIIREGEIGDRFYIIESGEVEVVHQEPGQPEQQLALRSTGDSFGELALLKDAPRAATVRCLTAVDVIMFNRKDFLTLAGSFHVFRHHMDHETTAVAEFQKSQMVNTHVGIETCKSKVGER
jgi:NADH dehydrogenase